MSKSGAWLLTLALAISSTIVFAQEQKPKATEEKHTLRLQTDSGRYGVSSDKLDPKQLGVAIYPGAKVKESADEGKGASLAFDWGRDSVRLYAQTYLTSASTEQVLSFYRKQLEKYGAVLECRGGQPVARVRSELKCEDGDHDEGIELKAGTESKQHIVGIKPSNGGTEFGIAYLDKTKHGSL